MSRTTDLEKDSILSFELNLFIVETSRHVHRAIHLYQQLVIGQLGGSRSSRSYSAQLSGRGRDSSAGSGVNGGEVGPGAMPISASCSGASLVVAVRLADQFQYFGISIHNSARVMRYSSAMLG